MVELEPPLSESMNASASTETEESPLAPFEQKGTEQLLAEHRDRKFKSVGEKIKFEIRSGLTAHNPSAPFTLFGREYVAVRADILEKELTSKVIICRKEDGVWKEANELPLHEFENAEDPSIVIIGGRPVLTFVRVRSTKSAEEVVEFGEDDGVRFNQEFYMMMDNGIFMPLPFQGPVDMKDIRLTPGGIVNVSGFGRPKEHKIGEETLYQGSGAGTISYFEAETLGAINSETIANAPLLEGMFKDGEWGGVNQVHILKNGLLGVVGHIAREDSDGKKHYYSIVFAFDPKTRQFSTLKMIAERADFPKGVVKPVRQSGGGARDDILEDVIFSGGLIRNKDGSATLFVGLSDAESGIITIEDPFLEYERLGGPEIIQEEHERLIA